ncbi:MAG: thioredoxin family protein [Chloroflexota bacterium]
MPLYLKKSLAMLFLVFATLINACSTGKALDPKHEDNKPIIQGQMNWEAWQARAGWHDYSAKDFNTSPVLINQISSMLKRGAYEFLIFAGSWCEDSESEVPKIFKILKSAQTPDDKIRLVGVDRDKKSGSGIETPYKIEKVPTLVILENGKEKGRIVEFPTNSWEEDILEIFIK